MDHAKFLELPEDERLAYLIDLSDVKLHWYQKLHIKLINKWWTACRESRTDLEARVLWESIYKGRF